MTTDTVTLAMPLSALTVRFFVPLALGDDWTVSVDVLLAPVASAKVAGEKAVPQPLLGLSTAALSTTVLSAQVVPVSLLVTVTVYCAGPPASASWEAGVTVMVGVASEQF